MEEMDAGMPWSELLALIAPHSPKWEKGRLRRAFQSCCACTLCSTGFALSDPAAEDALYDSATLRRFVGIDLPPHGRKTCPRGPRIWAARQRRTKLRS